MADKRRVRRNWCEHADRGTGSAMFESVHVARTIPDGPPSLPPTARVPRSFRIHGCRHTARGQHSGTGIECEAGHKLYEGVQEIRRVNHCIRCLDCLGYFKWVDDSNPDQMLLVKFGDRDLTSGYPKPARCGVGIMKR